MAKIKVYKWKEDLKFKTTPRGYSLAGVVWWRTTAEHGKSQGVVICPCCDTKTAIYLWSFLGTGKRCSACNVMLSCVGASINASEVTQSIIDKVTKPTP